MEDGITYRVKIENVIYVIKKKLVTNSIAHILSNIEIFISRRDIQKDQISLTSWGLWRQQID